MKMIRIQSTKQDREFILWCRYPITEENITEAIEDGRSAYYDSSFRQDPSYKDWRIEICEYDLIDGEPDNIRIIGSGPITEG